MTHAHFRHRGLLRWEPDQEDVESSDEEFEEFAFMAGLQPIGNRFYEGANVYRFFDASGTTCWCQLRGHEWTDQITADEASTAVRELLSQGLIEDSQNLFMWWGITNAECRE
ncbi:hypothetical protein GGI42DRAFT_282104 [Trichoderma sp. SZMC 28013]